MIERKVEKELIRWIRDGKKALLVDGARQVGKTYSIRRSLESSGSDYLEINLIEKPELIPAIENISSVEDLTVNLTASTGHKLQRGRSIIFIDEVQECIDLVTRIKFLVDEGSYRYVLSGSLLGVELRSLRSAPVGYVHEIKMYPLDIEEFLRASGVQEETIDYLRRHFENRTPVGEVVHNEILKHFYRYLVVGGMPEAVQKYVDTGDITEVSEIQRDIIQFYNRDFAKYESVDKKLLLTSIHERIPSQLLKQNRRFNYAAMKKGLRFERVENSFIWLYKAGVALPAFNVTEPRVALKLNEKSNLVKLYYSDIGMLTCSLGDAVRKDILFGERKANLGGVFENAVIQELTAHGFDVYYYNSKKLGELDFVVEYRGKILPLEIKSGKDYYVHSAINNVLDVADFGIEEAFVFTNYDITVRERTIYYPVYMSMFLNTAVHMPVIKVDGFS